MKSFITATLTAVLLLGVSFAQASSDPCAQYPGQKNNNSWHLKLDATKANGAILLTMVKVVSNEGFKIKSSVNWRGTGPDVNGRAPLDYNLLTLNIQFEEQTYRSAEENAEYKEMILRYISEFSSVELTCEVKF